MFDESMVRRAYRFLGRDRVAVCTMNPHYNAEWVESEDAFVEACMVRNTTGNIWVMLNEAKEGIEAAKVESKDIVSWTIIPFDVDAARKSPATQKDPATDSEAQEAVLIGWKIVAYLKNEYSITDYLFIMTGNGCAIWVKIPSYAINEDNWESIQDQNQAFQQMIQKRFNSPDVQIDTVGDLRRIMKVPGTLAVKGKEFGERKHRMATIVEEEKANE